MINVIQNNDEYRITFPYDFKIKELVKAVPGRRWNPEGRYWSIPLNHLGMLISQFKGTDYEDMLLIKSTEDINVNQTLDATQSIPDIDISDVKTYVKDDGKLYEHQLDFLKFAINRQNHRNMNGFICCDEMGCVSGDAIIQANIRGVSDKWPIAKLYKHFKNHPEWQDGSSFRVRCLKNGKFGQHPVKDILYSGKKEVYKLTTENDYSIKLTIDHKILTPNGYIELQHLSIGDEIITNGQQVCPRCHSSENLITYPDAKYKGYCKKCMYELRYLEHAPKYAEHLDTDGYILCRGTDIESWHGFAWDHYIYKHRLIMENHLGRRLEKHEVVHHIDGNPLNNDISNLELTNIWEHSKVYHDCQSHLMGKDYTTRAGTPCIVIPKVQTIKSIEYVGVEDTYDIKMYEPYHNFLANGIVVHNCGKSLEGLNLALYNRSKYNFKHCLIICCINMSKYNWMNEINIHTKGEFEGYIVGSRKNKKGVINYNGSGEQKLEDLTSGYKYGDPNEGPLPYFLILNIEAIRMKKVKTYCIANALIQMINKGDLNMIIIDEVHKNASASSQQGKQLMRIKKSTKTNCMWVPMTGTPIVNQPTDLFIPLRLIEAHSIDSYYKWNQNFCVFGGFGGHEIVGYKNMSQLKTLLQSNMIRRLKEDVLDLPDKIEMIEYVDNTFYQKRLMKTVEADILQHRDEIIKELNPLAKMLRLRQVNGSPELVDPDLHVDGEYLKHNAKLKRLIELLDDIIIRDEKVVIFSNWVEPLRTIYRHIAKKYKVCCFTGTMKEKDRQIHKDAFINNPEYKIMLGTIGALGTTHTLTAANNIIFYDEPWQAADRNQAIDRIHRISSTKSCNIYTILSKDTVDERVHKILYSKEMVSDFMVDGKLDIYNNPELFDILLGREK